MVVVSLFDGHSGGQIALRELRITPRRYYASEIDKHAIRQTMLNFPDTVQLGDVTQWRDWPIDWSSIDLLLAGSPCQGFSFAGKQLAFDDPRSALFFVFVDILNHCRKHNPDVVFLLENVEMKKSFLRIISEHCGLFPVHINSALVSAQNRERVYWSNIRTRREGLFGELHTDIPQPADRGIFLKDILEHDVPEKYYLKNLSAISPDVWEQNDTLCVAMRGRNKEPGSTKITQNIEPNFTGKTNCLTTVAKDNLIVQRGRGKNKGGTHRDKAPCLSSCAWEQNNVLALIKDGLIRIRRLTPTECARLQNIPEWYLWECSETQQYKMLGLGWTVEVIKHILSFFPNIEKYQTAA